MEIKVNMPAMITRSNPFTAANSYPKVPVSGNLNRVKLIDNTNNPNKQKLRLKVDCPFIIIINKLSKYLINYPQIILVYQPAGCIILD